MTSGARPRNVADYLPAMAAERPDAVAMYIPKKSRSEGGRDYDELSYRRLAERAERIAAGLLVSGLKKGDHVALMVRPGEDFFALMFGLFEAALVPVLIDPGIGKKNLGVCLTRAKPVAFIGIPVAHAARITLGWARESLRQNITVGRRWFWGGYTLAGIERAGAEALAKGVPLPEVAPEDPAAILFTSGSTGPAKGVVYTHGNFTAQVEALRDMFGIQPGEVNLPTFPPFALFDPALGVTSVIPFMDPTRPADVDPREVIEPVRRFSVTMMFGSPALLNTVGRYADAENVKLPSLRRVIAAGAPLPASTIERWQRILSDDARVYPPYGATESLPVACLSSDEIVNETWDRTDAGAGVCVGRKVESIELEIIAITDEPIANFSDATLLPESEIGEIVVRGPQVTRAYFADPEHTALAKIRDDDGGVWHRMGDLGWRDREGRVWFCGRKSHRVVLPDRTLYTVPLEKIFDAHERVFRSALVAPRVAGRIAPTLCLELERDARVTLAELLPELRVMGEIHADAAHIEHFLVHPGFPVDIRHNAKIDREALARWAEGKLR